MALIVEDGSGVVNANSYVSRADYIAYAATLGVTIADDAAADVELIKAAEYIDAHKSNMKGYQVNKSQDMAFPRYNVFIDGWHWSSNELPRNLILCQMRFAMDVHDGIDLFNRPANPNLVAKSEEVVGAVKVEYALDGANQKLGRSSKGDALLNSLLNLSGLYSITAVRA